VPFPCVNAFNKIRGLWLFCDKKKKFSPKGIPSSLDFPQESLLISLKIKEKNKKIPQRLFMIFSNLSQPRFFLSRCQAALQDGLILGILVEKRKGYAP